MTDPAARASGPVLWARAAALSVVALAVGGVAHAEAGGLLPGPLVLGLLVLLGTLAVAPLLRRPASMLRVVLLLVAGQGLVHTVLAVAAGHRGDPVAAPSPVAPSPAAPVGALGEGSRRGSFHDVAYDAAPAGAGDPLTVPAPLLHAFTDLVDHPVMALTHVLAAVACGWWLARGERALWQLFAVTARAWARPVVAVLVAVRAAALLRALRARLAGVRHVVALPDPPPRFAELHARRVPRRGPPLAA